ncbi:hect-domain (ubiquitin-transferase) domain-containing protein [Cystoisospora suis]|uniref:Hect-domain (Ubiquitin-transferase) domain-containing protein n=1 Tax=Cystoisospora suis TaxID=483139 RepID=A0A2C6L838_9APIC|nr:hect-domain (ubiquitin-transferase) domain-containing protein [Cystoisospora suis]
MFTLARRARARALSLRLSVERDSFRAPDVGTPWRGGADCCHVSSPAFLLSRSTSGPVLFSGSHSSSFGDSPSVVRLQRPGAYNASDPRTCQCSTFPSASFQISFFCHATSLCPSPAIRFFCSSQPSLVPTLSTRHRLTRTCGKLSSTPYGPNTLSFTTCVPCSSSPMYMDPPWPLIPSSSTGLQPSAPWAVCRFSLQPPDFSSGSSLRLPYLWRFPFAADRAHLSLAHTCGGYSVFTVPSFSGYLSCCHTMVGAPPSSLSHQSFSFPAVSSPPSLQGLTMSLASSALSSLTPRRFFGVGGSFGYDAFFRGASEVLNSSNVQLQHLPDTEDGSEADTATLHVARLPQQVKLLGAPYFFNSAFSSLKTSCVLNALLRKKRAAPLTFYHHLVDSSAANRGEDTSTVSHSALGHSHCFVASAQASQLRSKTLENVVFEHTRGFACQLILEGRGVKAYFDPDWPNLMVRLGVGVKPLALKRLAEQYATRAKIFVDKRGLILTVHGYDKCAVGTLTMSLFNHLQANPYTMKGAHVAMYPIKKKVSKKK